MKTAENQAENVHLMLDQKKSYWRHQRALNEIYEKRTLERSVKEINQQKEITERHLNNKNYNHYFKKKMKALEIQKTNAKLLTRLMDIQTRKNEFPKIEKRATSSQQRSSYAINKEKKEKEISITNNLIALKLLDQKPKIDHKKMRQESEQLKAHRERIQKFKNNENFTISKLESYASTLAKASNPRSKSSHLSMANRSILSQQNHALIDSHHAINEGNPRDIKN